MFLRRWFFFLICVFLFPVTLNQFLEARPQNRPVDVLPPPSQIQQSIPPPPESEQIKEKLPPLSRREIISWGFRVARKHPFL